MKITAIIPVYNEKSEVLSPLINGLSQYVDQIVIVDDGSNFDFKLAIKGQQLASRDLALTKPGCSIIVLRHQINRGQGAALQTGTDYAVQNGADIIIHIDGDGQHNPRNIPGLIEPILKGRADFVFGSKMLNKKNFIPWTKKYIIVPIARLINQLFSGLKLSDAHNGLRAFRASQAGQLILSQDRMAHNTEYSLLVKKNKLRYIEVPVEVSYKKYGQGVNSGIKIIKELLTGKIIG